MISTEFCLYFSQPFFEIRVYWRIAEIDEVYNTQVRHCNLKNLGLWPTYPFENWGKENKFKLIFQPYLSLFSYLILLCAFFKGIAIFFGAFCLVTYQKMKEAFISFSFNWLEFYQTFFRNFKILRPFFAYFISHCTSDLLKYENFFTFFIVETKLSWYFQKSKTL